MARSAWSTSRILVACLAVVGAIAVVVQIWGYVAWLLAPDFAPIAAPAAPPKSVATGIVQAQWALCIGVVLWLGYVVWDWLRRRELTWPVLWTVAWTLVFWQEPLVNVRDRTFSFNKGFVNRGDWTAHLPFIQHTSPLPESLLLEGPVFVCMLPLVAIGTAALMRLLRRYLRVSAVVVVVTWLVVGLFDMLFERMGIGGGLLAYDQLGGPAMDAGEPDQWPLYEGFAIGLAWALPGMVMFFRRYAPEPANRELAPDWWPGRRSALLTLLAAVGLVNLVFGLYNAGYALVMSGTVATIPPWL
jgi:hypothetical protein